MATIHLINTFGHELGGAQWRTLTLFELLSEVADVRLWSEAASIPWLSGRYPVQQITPSHFPSGGNLIFIGAYFRVSNWVQYANPARVVLLFNSHLVSDLENFKEGFSRLGLSVEVAFASEGIRSMAGGTGPIHVSPISQNRFQPRPNRSEIFTVGRMGRDDWTKHHPDDRAFFENLLDRGFRIRLMGCEVATWGLSTHPNLELLAMNQEAPEEFLNTLHVFHYRGHPEWYETFGRVNLEAMCCGIPVVAEARHGYTDYLRDGEGGYLYETDDQALSQIEALRGSPELWEGQSLKAIQAAEKALDPSKLKEVLDFYLR